MESKIVKKLLHDTNSTTYTYRYPCHVMFHKFDDVQKIFLRKNKTTMNSCMSEFYRGTDTFKDFLNFHLVLAQR